MRDPNVLYVTLAQVNATFVAIFGAFLLSYGLSFIAQFERIRHRQRVKSGQLQALADEVHAKAREAKSRKEKLDHCVADIFRRMLLSHLAPKEAEAERQRLFDDYFSWSDSYSSWLAGQVSRQESFGIESDEIGFELDQAKDNIKRILIAYRALSMLALFGVGTPIMLLQLETGESESWVIPSVRYGSIALLTIVLVAITAVSFTPSEFLSWRPWIRLLLRRKLPDIP